MASNGDFAELLDAMKHAAATLRDNEIPFALAGSLAVYARGGPATTHDVDFILEPDAAERALAVLSADGWRTERPPEGWLYKVFDEHGSMIDLIYSPNGQPPSVVRQILDRAEEIEVYAIKLKVMSPTDVIASKLLALREHYLDYEPALEIARALREQIDWHVVEERVKGSPYAAGFLTLAQQLGLAPATRP